MSCGEGKVILFSCILAESKLHNIIGSLHIYMAKWSYIHSFVLHCYTT